MTPFRLVFSSTAFQDLQRIYRFLQEAEPQALETGAERLEWAFSALQRFPHSGYSLENLPDFRELLVPFGKGNYVIRYRIEKTTVNVVHLWHSREDRF